MYYKSNWYASHFYRSNFYDGSGGLTPLAEHYFDRLGDLGYTGAFSDREQAYLRDLGFEGGMATMKQRHLLALGYTGALPSQLQQKAQTEGYRTVSDMMRETGLIPL